MRKGTLKSLIEHFEEIHEDKVAAWEAAADEIDLLAKEKKIDPAQISLRSVFEETVGPVADFQTSSPEVIAEAIHSSGFPTITNTLINSLIIPAYESAVGPAVNLVQEGNASRTGTDTVVGFTATDGPELRREYMAYTEVGFGEKKIQVDMADFGRMISLSREAIFDDRTGEIVRRARAIGDKAGQHRAIFIIQTLEVLSRSALGESSTRAFVRDGTAISIGNFYSSDHSSVTGLDAQTNDTTLADALSYAALDTAFQLFGNMTDENGDKMSLQPSLLLLPVALQSTGWQILKSQLNPDNAENAANFFGPQGMGGISLMVSPHLTNSNYWYLGSPASQLLWLWVWRPETKTQSAGSDLAFTNQVVMRIRYSYHGGVAHTDYRNIVRGGTP